MKHILNRSFLAAMLLGVTVGATEVSFAQAQEPKRHGRAGKVDQNLTPEQRIEKRLEKMKSKLNLTDAQANEIRSIMREEATDIKAAREAIASAQSQEAKKAAQEKLFAERMTAKERVAAVLTDEQRTKMKERFKEGRHKMHELKRHQREERRELRQELRDQK